MKEFSIESIIPQNRCLVGYCRHYRYRQVPHNPTEKKKTWYNYHQQNVSIIYKCSKNMTETFIYNVKGFGLFRVQ